LRYDHHQKLNVFFLQLGLVVRDRDMVTIAIADNGDGILKGWDFSIKNVSTILSQCDPF
jgi:hypothetical protein